MTRKTGSGAWFAASIYRPKIQMPGWACCGKLCGNYDLKNFQAAEPRTVRQVRSSTATLGCAPFCMLETKTAQARVPVLPSGPALQIVLLCGAAGLPGDSAPTPT